MKFPIFTFLIIIYVTLFAGRTRGSHHNRRTVNFAPRLTRQAARYGVPSLNYRGYTPVSNNIGGQNIAVKASPPYGAGSKVPRPVNGVGSYSFGGRYANKQILNTPTPDFSGGLRENFGKPQIGFANNVNRRPLTSAVKGGSGQYFWSNGNRFN